MNKIYKVIWNVCRGIHVVTDENHRAHGKEASSLIVPVELLVLVNFQRFSTLYPEVA